MKRKILLILLIITIYSCKAQEKIDFKVGYLPNFEYILTQKQISETQVKFFASDEILEKLKNYGVENPTLGKDTTLVRTKSKTGKPENNVFPINIEILQSQNLSFVNGTKFYGKSVNGKIELDSISTSTMTAEKKKNLLSATESMINEFIISNKKIRIGESFEKKNSMTIPFAGVTTELEITSIYTLKEIESGIGFFELNQIYGTKNNEINIDGKGKGYIEYDIKKQFYTKFYLEMKMKLRMKLENYEIELQSKSKTEQTTEIKASR